MTGTNGNDVLTGTSGDDTICGLNGNDTIRGLGGNDTLVGGDGNDTLLPGPGDDTVEGDAGTNTVAYSDITPGGVTVNLQAGTASGPQAGSDTLSGIQNVNGTDQADTITGDANANLLNGLGGPDLLSGAGGNDNLAPGLGNDPSVDGGSGDDYVNYSAITSGGVTVNLTTGSTAGAGGTDTLSNIEWAIGSNQNDTLRGSAGDNILKGLGGNDQLFGNDGNDTLLPGAGTGSVNGGNGGDWASFSDLTGGGVTVDLGAGTATGPGASDTLSFVEKVIGTNQDDSLTGDNSANTLNGLAGNDSLFGSGGIDTLVPGIGDDPVVNGGAGLDYVSYGDLTGGGVTVDLTAQTASGPTAGNDTLAAIDNVTGSNQADTITGNTGPNIVYGLGGADVIAVGEGNNTVFGGDGDDLITAGTGDDTIDGGNNVTGNPGDQCFADGGTNTVTNCETTNRAPVAVDDPALGQEASFTTDQNTAFNTGDVTANDTDLDGDALAVNTLDVTGTNGLVTQNPDNKTFHYDPNGFYDSLPAGQSATDTFKYTVSDGHGGTSNQATVTITINGLNDAPTATPDSGAGFGTDQNTSFTTGNVLPNDSDPDTGDTLSVSNLDTTGTDGTVTNNNDGTFGYDPNGAFDYLGTGQTANDVFHYTVSDGHGGTDTTTVTIQVTGLNDAPTAFDDSGASFTTNEDSSFTTGSVLSNDVDPDSSDTLSVSNLDTTGTVGTVTNNNDGTFGYNPNGNFNSLSVGQTANDTFKYTASDGHGGTDTATVTITITGVNDPPTAVDDTKSTDEDTSTAFDPRTNDSDPDSADTLTITSVNTVGTVGGVTITGGGTGISYNPAGHFDSLNVGDTAPDSFTYTISDGHGGTDTATVNLTITGVNDAPVGVGDTFNGSNSALSGVTLAVSTSPSTPKVSISGNVLTNDTDVDTPHINLTASAGSSSTNGGAVSMNSDGTYTYTTPPGFIGSDTFSYTVHDNGSPDKTANATITINVVGPRVWFVNPGGSAGNGTSATPFSSLAPISSGGGSDSLDGTGDVVFVYQGTGNAASGGFVLEDSQTLTGQPQGLSVTDSLARTFSLVTAGGSNPTITNSGGTGLTLAQGNTIRAVTVSGSSGSGIAGTSVNSTTVASNVSVSGNGGSELDLNGGNGAISFAAPITNGSAGRAISIQNRTGGTSSISGSVTDNSGTGTGILLSSNTGATINFTGALAISTGGSTAFAATGGGTVSVDNTSVTNTLATTTATALNVQNTTIGSPGLKFRSIAVTGNGSSPSNGITLNNTGSTSGLVVTGAGSVAQGGDFSGGTITGIGGVGISLASTDNLSLNNMRVMSTTNAGVRGTNVTNFAFTNGTVSGNGSGHTQYDSNIAFNDDTVGTVNNIDGTLTVTNNVLSTAYQFGVDVYNKSGSLSDLNVSTNAITSSTDPTQSVGSGIRIQALGSSTTASSITRAEIQNNAIQNFPSAAGIILSGGNTAGSGGGVPTGTFGTNNTAGSGLVQVTGNTIRGQSSANPMAVNAVAVFMSGKGSGFISISSNGTVGTPIAFMRATAITINSTGFYNLTATANSNVINAQSQNGGAFGIAAGADNQVLADTTTADSAVLNITVSSNSISNQDAEGVKLLANHSATVNARVQNNTVSTPIALGGSLFNGIRVDSGGAPAAAIDTKVCLELTGNTTTGSNGMPGIGLRKQGTVTTTNDFGVVGMAATASPGVEQYVGNAVGGKNPNSGNGFGNNGVLLISGTSGFSSCVLPF